MMLERFVKRLHRDDSGFSLIETVVALLLLFGLLAALETTALTGFRYVGFARERQAGTHIANQVMEEIRGLAYAKIQAGVQTSDLATDPNAVTACLGDPASTYRFQSCAGEIIIKTPTNCPTTSADCLVPLVPNNGTCPGSPLPLCTSATYPVTYSWRTYVTNSDTARNPYRVSVIVTWISKSVSNSVTQQVKVQSLFWSPTGCNTTSLTLHPFATPCNPFFYGLAQYPQGQITVAGTVSGTTFQTGTLLLAKGESDLQQEQVSQIQGSIGETGTSVVDGAGTHTGGSATAQTIAADADPASSALQYSSSSLTGLGSSFTTGTCASSNNCITIANAANDSGTVDAATSAGGTNVCPPSPATAETDLLPCGGSRVQQAGTLSLIANIQSSNNPNVGAVTLAQVAAPGAATTTLANRNAISGQDGLAQQTVSRTAGQMDIGGLPAWITSNCTGGSAPPAGFTYFLSLQGYSDSVVATAGSTAAAPTATINGGTLKYWTGTNGAATQTSVAIATTPGYSVAAGSSSIGCTKSGKTVTAAMSWSIPITMGSQPATSSTPAGAGSILRNDVQATIGSPVYGTFTYTIVAQGSTLVNLTFTVNLGTITSRAVYQAAPTA